MWIEGIKNSVPEDQRREIVLPQLQNPCQTVNENKNSRYEHTSIITLSKNIIVMSID